MIGECKKRAKSDRLFAYCLNSSQSRPTNEKFSERDFSFYQSQILKKISAGDCLIFRDPDFKALAVQMSKISDILTNPSVLTKQDHARNPGVFRQIITLLESLNRDNGTRFTTMPRPL